jgi:pimeloyl-ACP methyl ester carboxylesterase
LAIKLVFALLLLLAGYCLYKYRRSAVRYQPFTDDFHLSGGSSARLSQGRISYQWHGPDDGETIVLAHGLATPKFVWNNTIPALTGAGYRVLSYDHFGRGNSERPRVPYNRGFYISELKELLDTLHVVEPVNLIGYSMGGGTVTSFAAEYSNRVEQLLLLAPAGFVPRYQGPIRLLTLPLLGEWLLTVGGADLLLKELYKAAEEGRIGEEVIRQFKSQFYIQGSPHALASTLRHYPMYDLSEDYRKVGESKLKVSAVLADQDDLVPIASAEKIRQLIPDLRLEIVPGAGHDFVYTQAETVNPLILSALKHE